jgi:hypothetical protein
LEAKVVKSLDGEDDELYNFIPYLLQDLWEIGSSPEVIINMVKKHVGKSNLSVLDLGCGKGAVSVKRESRTERVVWHGVYQRGAGSAPVSENLGSSGTPTQTVQPNLRAK